MSLQSCPGKKDEDQLSYKKSWSKRNVANHLVQSLIYRWGAPGPKKGSGNSRETDQAINTDGFKLNGSDVTKVASNSFWSTEYLVTWFLNPCYLSQCLDTAVCLAQFHHFVFTHLICGLCFKMKASDGSWKVRCIWNLFIGLFKNRGLIHLKMTSGKSIQTETG